jgi:oxygen-independent coproporphyrinogen-3 oxidase
MEAWLEAGINRLSLGFQSLDQQALRFLERAHDADEAVAVFRRARGAGFSNINCDLIFAIPGLTTARWREVLAAVLALDPDHISAYELTPEAGTRLGADVAAGRTVLPDDDHKLDQYALAEQMLQRAGLRRYEVSNWARPGRECRHNIAYWSGVPYAAAGAGAHAYLHGDLHPSWLGARPGGATAVRQWNVASPAAYVQAVRKAGHAAAGHEWLDPGTAVGDQMMMGLRLDAGVDLEASSTLFGLDVEALLAERLRRLTAGGLLQREGTTVRTTPRGREVLNAVTRELMFAAAATGRHSR